ncbi:MAG: putative ABC transporter ATP-binding protein [Candidatus Carbobacillus altaicus]|uniref:Putative ABC transporter ATP-binding protein n=1 Tax=Candidatus Carbonibacillus altaicus TaxID=2163959 RepID=A0A2R6Y536_9BACL|nr:MAG: putative ABC transporter ATP-binding protein [Candidatus Carbobacillus altaicus]
MWDEVRRLREEEGLTVLLTTQYLDEADRLADRVAIFDQGRIMLEGSPDDLKRAAGNVVAVALDDPGQLAEALVDPGSILNRL